MIYTYFENFPYFLSDSTNFLTFLFVIYHKSPKYFMMIFDMVLCVSQKS